MLLARKAMLFRKIMARVTTLFFVSVTCSQANSQSASSPSPSIGQPPPILIVQLDSNGRAYINGKPVARNPLSLVILDDPLAKVLMDFNMKNPCGLVVLATTGATQYVSVVGMLDLFRRVGVNRMSLGFPLNPKDGVFIPVSSIVELNQLSPPTLGSLYPSQSPTCSQEPFNLPEPFLKPNSSPTLPKISPVPVIPPTPIK